MLKKWQLSGELCGEQRNVKTSKFLKLHISVFGHGLKPCRRQRHVSASRRWWMLQPRKEKKREVQTGVRALIKEVPLSLPPSLFLSLPDTLEQSKTHNPSAAAGGAAERKAFWPGNL